MIRSLIIAFALLAGLSAAPSVAGTTRVTLYATASPDPVAAWVDLGATPINVRVLGSDYALIVVDTVAPSTFDADATILGNGSETGRDFTAPGQHVYARALNNQTRVAVTPTGAGGASAGAMSVGSGTGGISSFSRIPSSAAGNNLTLAKATTGRAYSYQGCNTTASTVYMRLYNAASTGAVTVGTTAPFAGPYAFPANTCIQATAFAADIGVSFSAGIAYAFGTAPADSDATMIGAGAITAFQIGLQ